MNNVESLFELFQKQDRRALAQVITIIESTNPKDKIHAQWLLKKILKRQSKTIRIAISGAPGVGKSTFINTLGQKIIDKGYFLGVLPIDPSSEYSGGSILGDKTRMKELLTHERVFIRPSPSKGVLGGVSLSTPDTLSVMEAFGCDFLLVETVGVGQSEVLAHSLCDHFVMLLEPGLGDSLQLMKKGILESADFILINKVDEYETLGKRTLNSLLGSKPHVFAISALKDIGIDAFLDVLLKRHLELESSGDLSKSRDEQRKKLFDYCFTIELEQHIFAHEGIRSLRALGSVDANTIGFLPAASDLVNKIMKNWQEQ